MYLHGVDDIYAVQEETLPEVPKISLDMLRMEVTKDPTLHRLLPYIQQGTKPDKEQRKLMGSIRMCYVKEFERLSQKEGVIYYTTLEVEGQHSRMLLCLPVQLYGLAFDWCHQDLTSGHYG